jgi:hypothetical protein
LLYPGFSCMLTAHALLACRLLLVLLPPVQVCQQQNAQHPQLKINLHIRLVFEDPDNQGQYTMPHSTLPVILVGGDPHAAAEAVSTLSDRAQQMVDGLNPRKSGQQLLGAQHVRLDFAVFDPMVGACHRHNLPAKVQHKHATVTVNTSQRPDQYQHCFMWAILACLHQPARHAQRPSKYDRFVDDYSWEGLPFPTSLADIREFEKRNHIRVNVFGVERVPARSGQEADYKAVFLRHSSVMDSEAPEANLLLYKQHYYAITRLSALLNSASTCHNHVCTYCLKTCNTATLLRTHRELCSMFSPAVINMPAPGSTLRFSQLAHCIRHPLVIYADFESILQRSTALPAPTTTTGSSTTPLQVHKPIGWNACVVSDLPFTGSTALPNPDGSVRYIRTTACSGEDAAETFLRFLQGVRQDVVGPLFDRDLPMLPLSDEQEASFEQQEFCLYCNRALRADRVHDHDHRTGAYRGAAHAVCNLEAGKVEGGRRWRQVPVFFHNLRGYDAHHLVQGMIALEQAAPGELGRISVIAETSESYKSVSFWGFKFVDSNQLMPGSLAEHMSNLPDVWKRSLGLFAGCDKFGGLAGIRERFNDLKGKGVFPYDWFDGPGKLGATALPPREAWCNLLTGKEVSDEDLSLAQRVWESFGCRSMEDYMHVYMGADVAGLVDVMEYFRLGIHREYGIDPVHCISAPSLSWQAMLRFTRVELELLSDSDMYMFFERGIRGGLAVVATRHAVASNHYVGAPAEGEPLQQQHTLFYFDCNGLYGHAMSGSLPIRGFRWLGVQQAAEVGLVCGADGRWELGVQQEGQGFLVSVDLEYPSHLHALHDDYPAAPEACVVQADMLSAYSRQVLEVNGRAFVPAKKLLATLQGKQHYVVHHTALRQYLKLGLRVTAVHKILVFREERWLAPFVDHNAAARQAASNDFEKGFYKLLNNSTFGKCMENVRGYRDFRICVNREQYQRQTKKPTYSRTVRFGGDNSDFCIVEQRRGTVRLDKPIYAGQAILDSSKAIMYGFHYGVMKPLFGEQMRLLFTDTDSLAYVVRTAPGHDAYAALQYVADSLDLSAFPDWHPLHSQQNARVPGKFKDELCGGGQFGVMEEFVGLRAKVYAYSVAMMDPRFPRQQGEGREVKKLKGLKRGVVKGVIRLAEYRGMVQPMANVGADLLHAQVVLRSRLHVISTEQQVKRSLSSYDDKRYILPCGVHTMAYGHFMLSAAGFVGSCPFCARLG